MDDLLDHVKLKEEVRMRTTFLERKTDSGRTF